MGLSPKTHYLEEGWKNMKKVKKGEWYTSNECKPNKNVTTSVYKLQIITGLVGEKCKKLI